jgi:molybdopterin synthase sulfur carrier subunit
LSTVAHVHIPRSLAALFPGVPRRLELTAADVEGVIRALDERYPGMWDRLCVPGPHLRPHMRAFVDRRPATLRTPVDEASLVHLIPAVSGGDAYAYGRLCSPSGDSAQPSDSSAGRSMRVKVASPPGPRATYEVMDPSCSTK